MKAALQTQGSSDLSPELQSALQVGLGEASTLPAPEVEALVEPRFPSRERHRDDGSPYPSIGRPSRTRASRTPRGGDSQAQSAATAAQAHLDPEAAARDFEAPHLFGTDGIRGRAGEEPLTPVTVQRVGRALAKGLWRDARPGVRPRVVVGLDTRASGPEILAAVSAGLRAMGVDVLEVGVVPTAALSFLLGDLQADAAIMISASHNPHGDNGLKIIGADGFKLSDEAQREIEILVHEQRLGAAYPPSSRRGRKIAVPDAQARYGNFVRAAFPGLDLRGMKIVVDAANGAAFRTAPAILSALGAEVDLLGASPDGRNINEACGSQHPRAMADRVRAIGADLGLALDGDADRVVLADETGRLLDGDDLLAIIARHMKERGELTGDTVVATVMSNGGLEEALEAMDLRLVRTAVGDRFVTEALRANGWVLGGEQNGHLMFPSLGITEDGTVAAIKVLEAMGAAKVPLSRLDCGVVHYPQLLLQIPVARKPKLEDVPALMAAIGGVEAELGPSERLLVRYSGTEPKLRIMVECRDQERVEDFAGRIAATARAELGAG